MDDGAGPFAGSRIIELADVVLGQHAVMVPAADLGADAMPEGSPGRTAAGPTGCLEPDERQAGGSSAGSRIAKGLRPTLYPPAAWTCRTRTACSRNPRSRCRTARRFSPRNCCSGGRLRPAQRGSGRLGSGGRARRPCRPTARWMHSPPRSRRLACGWWG